jgi:hypothetical protein
MPKTKISEFDVDPANNTDINSINIAEGCAPSGINNAIRQLMSDLKEFQTGAGGDPFNGAVNGTVGATTPASGAFTSLSASGAFSANGGATLGDASGDALTINSSAVSIPNGLNFDSNTFVIDATNNRVGVGTSSPSNKLSVYGADVEIGNGLNDGKLTVGSFVGTGSQTDIKSGGFTTFTTFSGGAFYERMRIDSSGNVGIGTTDTTGIRLGVNSGSASLNTNFNSTNASGVYVRFQNSSTSIGDIGGGGSVISGGTAGDFAMASRSGNLVLGTGSTERMRIDSSGNLLVGTTSGSGNKVDIEAGNGMRIAGWGSGIGTGLTMRTAVSATSDAISFVYNSTQVGRIQTTSSATSYVTSSDYRLKEDVAPMTGALAKVSALKPVTYKWKIDGSDGQGFIAHELQEVVPDCVTGEKDAVDEEGNPRYQGIDTSFLTATLTAAIQEQQALIQSQADTITAMEARLTALENK